jgi:hypothetical protein
MNKQQLMRTLDELRAELAGSDRVDPETLERLERLTADLQQSLDQRETEIAAEEEPEPVSGLKDLLLKYEAEHPQLSASIGRVADALAAMGF